VGPGGHAVGILAPGGYVVRTDPEGKKWELLLAGFGNSYDLILTRTGKMFTFDSDMEWGLGSAMVPSHADKSLCPSVRSSVGAPEQAVWPSYYPDSLPATVNIGVGLPTGVKFGTKK